MWSQCICENVKSLETSDFPIKYYSLIYWTESVANATQSLKPRQPCYLSQPSGLNVCLL